MESCAFKCTKTLFTTPPPSCCSPRKTPLFFSTPPSRAAASKAWAMKSPRGFGPPPPQKSKNTKKKRGDEGGEDEEGEESPTTGPYEDTIPEIVTDRMLRRMGFSVGIPLVTGLLFFPFFYYLKVGLKVDVPTWLVVMVSFVCFGSALLGVSYGIVSSSWEPMREGSLLGWNEAQKNWPVFWQSLWRKDSK